MMIHVEALSNFNYAINYRGCGPRLYEFDVEDVNAAVKNDIKVLMGQHITQVECLVTYEAVDDARYEEQIIVFNLSIYVVFKIDSEDYIDECLLTIGDYMSRSFVRDITVE